MYKDNINLCQKQKRIGKTYTDSENIQDKRVDFGLEQCAMLVMKSGKWHMGKGIEWPNQEKSRTLGENKTYKYLGILEADTIKQVEMKEKIKRVSQEN